MEMKDIKAISIPESVVANTAQTFSSTSNTNGSLTYFNYYPTSTSNLGLCKALRIKGKYYFNSATYSWSGLWYFDINGSQVQITPTIGTATEFNITCYLNQDSWVSGKWNVFVIGAQISGSSYRRIRVVVNKTNNTNLDFYTQSDSASEICNVEIDSVEVGVSKITNSNGDIIWGSQEAFPYRRLEYVHTNGTDNYLTTGCTTNTTKYREVTFSMDSAETPSGDIYILGSRNTSAAAAQQRYWLPRIDGNGIRFVIGSTWTSNNAYPVPTYIVANEKRTVFATTSTSSSNMKMDFGLKNASGSNMFTGNITGGAVSGFSSRELILMATNDGSGNSGVTPKGYCAGRLYSFIERNTNASGTITHRLIPCQRKSDGKVGMYDVTTSTFNEMQGTTDSTSLGPIVDEYWDLTA